MQNHACAKLILPVQKRAIMPEISFCGTNFTRPKAAIVPKISCCGKTKLIKYRKWTPVSALFNPGRVTDPASITRPSAMQTPRKILRSMTINVRQDSCQPEPSSTFSRNSTCPTPPQKLFLLPQVNTYRCLFYQNCNLFIMFNQITLS